MRRFARPRALASNAAQYNRLCSHYQERDDKRPAGCLLQADVFEGGFAGVDDRQVVAMDFEGADTFGLVIVRPGRDVLVVDLFPPSGIGADVCLGVIAAIRPQVDNEVIVLVHQPPSAFERRVVAVGATRERDAENDRSPTRYADFSLAYRRHITSLVREWPQSTEEVVFHDDAAPGMNQRARIHISFAENLSRRGGMVLAISERMTGLGASRNG